MVLRRDHPGLSGSFDRMLRRDELVAVLPGAYVRPGLEQRWDVRVAALARRHPDAVLVCGSAAHATYWPGLPVRLVECAVPRPCAPAPGYRFTERRVPPELVAEVDGLRVSVPALTAIELCTTAGGEAIDRALRTRTATLQGMWEALALTTKRPGNADRRSLLLDSRDEPWSEAERLCHRLLREAGIDRWKANRPVTADGRLFYLDIVFREAMLVLEIDGRLHELDEDVFENDRHRQNALVLDGWHVLRFTWRMLVDQPDLVIASVRSALARFR